MSTGTMFFHFDKKGKKKSSRSLKVITAVCSEVINKRLLCSSASPARYEYASVEFSHGGIIFLDDNKRQCSVDITLKHQLFVWVNRGQGCANTQFCTQSSCFCCM